MKNLKIFAFKIFLVTISILVGSSQALSLPILKNNSEPEFFPPFKKEPNGETDTLKESTFNKSLGLQITFPYLNTFYIQQLNKKDITAGFLGVSGGVEFLYNVENFILINAGVAIDFPFFIPVPIDQSGDFEIENSVTNYISLRNHYKFEKFDFGYGLQLSQLFWQKKYFRDAGIPASPVQAESFESTALGLSFAANMFTSDNFKFGILYQPNLYSFSPESKFDYQHFASIEFGWRFSIWLFE